MNYYIGDSEATQDMVALITNAPKANVVPILWGEPGVGKTALIEAVSRQMGLPEPIVVIGSGMDPADVHGTPHVMSGADGLPYDYIVPPSWYKRALEQVAQYGKAMVFFDEASNTPPAVQAPLLVTLESKVVGDKKLPAEVIMVAAANPASSAADGWILSPPMSNRFSHFTYRPTDDEWFTGMLCAWNKPNISDAEMLLREKIVAFLRANPELIQAMPDNPEEAGQAWPSMRTWDKSAAYASSFTETRLLNKAIRGLVGDKASLLFSEWLDELKLPPYEQVIANPEAFRWENLQADRTHLFLSMALRSMNLDNYLATIHMLEVAGTQGNKQGIVSSLFSTLQERLKFLSEEAGIPTDRLAISRLMRSLGLDLKDALARA